MSRLNTWLTGEQTAFLEMLDDAISKWPHRKPETIHLKPRQFNTFRVIRKKKEKFPDSNGHIPVEGDKYKGVQIVKI